MKMAEEEKAEFFVKLDNPNEFRQSLLEGSKNIIKTLERYEMLKSIRRQKILHISELKNIIKDLQILSDKLKEALPKTKLRYKAKAKPLAKAKKPAKELADMEGELKKIEAKLGSLG